MATPKLDYMCVDFLKRIPDVFREQFTPGQGSMPDGNYIRKEEIVDYVNRGMFDLFNNYWQATGGDIKKFTAIFPELIKVTGNLTLEAGNYTIKEPYKDMFKVIGGITSAGRKYMKTKDEYLYTLYLSEEYKEYTATEKEPVIIQVSNMVAVFPQTFTGQIKLHYIRCPLDPNSGRYLQQNGSEDSPFHYHWHKQIVDYAYLRYLEETNQTS